MGGWGQMISGIGDGLARSSRPLVAAALALALLAPCSSVADEAPAPALVPVEALPPTAPPALPPQELTEVIVTAQKTKQTLEQVPASVTSIGGDFIREIGAKDFTDLQNYSANTNIELSSSSGQYLIRGLGTLNDVPGLDPSVGLVVDGVVYTYSQYLVAFFSDIDHFEVLRGPQGTLFGKNTSAGLLNVTTNTPVQQPVYKLDLIARSYGDFSFQPVANVPLTDKLALRVSGNFEHGDQGTLYNTYLKRGENDLNQDTGRARMRFDSHHGWTLDGDFFYSSQFKNFNLEKLFIVSPSMAALDKMYDPEFDTNIRYRHISADVPAQEKSILRGTHLTFEIDLGKPGNLQSLVLTATTALSENVIGARDLDGDFSPVPFILDTLVTPEPQRQLVQEIRVAGKAPDVFGMGHEVNFVTGLYYDNYTLKTSDNFQIENLPAAGAYLVAADAGTTGSGVVPPGTVGTVGGQFFGSASQLLAAIQALTGAGIPPQNAQSGLNERTEDYAYFGQLEWRLLSDFGLIGGVRYGKENRTADAYSASQSTFIMDFAHEVPFEDHLNRTETNFSPKAGLTWHPNTHASAFLTFSRGYKSGGFNGIPLNPDNIEFGPERATSFEGGVKFRTHLMGGPMRDSLSIFDTGLKNLQVSTFQGTNVVVVNAAAARTAGFENDLLWLLPIRGFSIYSSSGLADARYTSYKNGPVAGDHPGCQASVDPTGIIIPAPACYQDLTGRRLPFAPRWTASFVPAYTEHLPASLSSTFAVDLLYQGDRYLNSEDDPRELQKSTKLVNTRLVVADDAAGAWAFTLAANNLTREVILDQVLDQPLAPGDFAGVRIDRGRFYTANLSMTLH